MRNSGSDADLTLAEVANRLHHSARWVQTRLAEDARSSQPRLQHHHHIGRKPLWTEEEFLMLRCALIAAERDRRGQGGLRLSRDTVTGTSKELFVFEDAHDACAAVLTFRHVQNSKRRHSRSSGKSRT